MEFQRNSLFLSLATVVLHMCSSLSADCNTLPRDAVFASATINKKTFLEQGSFPATPFPKSTRGLTDSLVITAIWKPASSPPRLPTGEETLPARLLALALLCIPKNRSSSHTRLLQPFNCPSSPRFGAHAQQFTEKRCGLIWYSQTRLNPRVLGSSWTVQNQGKYKVTTSGVLRA